MRYKSRSKGIGPKEDVLRHNNKPLFLVNCVEDKPRVIVRGGWKQGREVGLAGGVER